MAGKPIAVGCDAPGNVVPVGPGPVGATGARALRTLLTGAAEEHFLHGTKVPELLQFGLRSIRSPEFRAAFPTIPLI